MKMEVAGRETGTGTADDDDDDDGVADGTLHLRWYGASPGSPPLEWKTVVACLSATELEICENLPVVPLFSVRFAPKSEIPRKIRVNLWELKFHRVTSDSVSNLLRWLLVKMQF